MCLMISLFIVDLARGLYATFYSGKRILSQETYVMAKLISQRSLPNKAALVSCLRNLAAFYTKVLTGAGFVLVTSGQQSEQCGLAILYDPKSGLTKGVLHCKRFKEHIGLLEQAVTLAGHPMLLLVLLTSYVIGLSSSQMEDDLTMITKVIEVETGQNLYGPAKKVNRLTIDYGKTTRETNMLLTDLGWTKLKLVSLSLLYRSFKNCFDEIDGGIDNERRRDRIIEESKTLREIVEHQQSITNNLLLHIDSIHERAKNELDIVCMSRRYRGISTKSQGH
ncbi:hypothetical protein MPH_07481 [Macrophomina phaseolina MS6]|uniref:Uncharacterized protein n=1 Tax=Macrophomina phaseolina (strain MS6) TaxID=1126212 RepID=K2RYP0_MACPH|nr:hypothetical protein MPH_07481 [Macrophomina phaseolina MS6]